MIGIIKYFNFQIPVSAERWCILIRWFSIRGFCENSSKSRFQSYCIFKPRKEVFFFNHKIRKKLNSPFSFRNDFMWKNFNPFCTTQIICLSKNFILAYKNLNRNISTEDRLCLLHKFFSISNNKKRTPRIKKKKNKKNMTLVLCLLSLRI